MYNLVNDTEVTLHSQISGIGTHLTLDTTNNVVYWVLFTVESNYKIYKTTYNGTTSQIGPDQVGSIDSVDIAVGIEYLYILDSEEIKKYNKTTDTIAETISLRSKAKRMIFLAGKYKQSIVSMIIL